VRVTVAGFGCVTPLGATAAETWDAIRVGKKVVPSEVIHPETGRSYLGAPVPAGFTSGFAREARLRRSSAISLLGATAAKGAIENSGLAWSREAAQEMAIVFAVSSGGVQYTRRFYEQVVKQGANAASPMLFPETVYNAPASHVAALLGVDGATYTLVGDGTVGLQALAFGAQLLQLRQAARVLVVAAEELDWILLEAHRNWRLVAGRERKGALLAEGAAAVVLTEGTGTFAVDASPGHSFVSRKEAQSAIVAAAREHAGSGSIDVVVSGGNETWADGMIERAVRKCEATSRAPIIRPKLHFGEALGAGSLLQLVVAASALGEGAGKRALVASLGWNQQAATALLERAS
jgi:3-oxoacyl-(acyl-carrier-protein) synthase